MKKNAPDHKTQSAQDQVNNNIINNSLPAQRHRLIEALDIAPVTTNQARTELNIMHPAARIMELRQSGYVIVKEMTEQTDMLGRKHKAAKYFWIKSVTKGDEV